MTLDELKAEAKKQGYRLIKITPTVKILPCPVCGSKRTAEWLRMRDGGGYIRRCYNYNCDFEGDWAKTANEAKRKWNETVLKHQKED